MTAAVNCQQFEDQVVELALGRVDEPRRAELAHHAATCPSCHLRLEELSWLGERLLLLAPEIEPPPGFESRVLERLANASASSAASASAGSAAAGSAAAPAASAGSAGAGSAAAPAAAARGAPAAGGAPAGSAGAADRRAASRRGLIGAVAAAFAGAVIALSAAAATDRWGGAEDEASPTTTVAGDQTGSTTGASGVAGPVARVATIVRADGSVVGTAVLAAEPRPHLLVTVNAPRPRATPVRCELVGADGRSVEVGSWTFADVERGAWAVGIEPGLLDAVRMDVKDETGATLASASFGA